MNRSLGCPRVLAVLFSRSTLLGVALATAGGGCGQAFTTASDGGVADQRADDRSTADVPGSDGSIDSPEPDAGCPVPDGASGAVCAPGIDGLLGWTLVSYEAGGTACPGGYEGATFVMEAGGTPTCSCTCSGGTLCMGHYSLFYDSSSAG